MALHSSTTNSGGVGSSGSRGSKAPRSSKLSKLKRRRRSSTPPPVPPDLNDPSAPPEQSSLTRSSSGQKHAPGGSTGILQHSTVVAPETGILNNELVGGVNSALRKRSSSYASTPYEYATATGSDMTGPAVAPNTAPPCELGLPSLADGKTLKRRRRRSTGTELRAIFGCWEGQENGSTSLVVGAANRTSTAEPSNDESSSTAAPNDAEYVLKYHTVGHPILGSITVPAISLDGDAAKGKSDSDSGSSAVTSSRVNTSNNIEFRKSLGINEADVSFPSTVVASAPGGLTTKGVIRKGKSSIRYRMGDGLLVPLSALKFPNKVKGSLTSDNLITESKPLAAPTPTQVNETKRTAMEGAAGISSSIGMGTVRIVSEKGATIREDYEIDNSQAVLGKLRQHEQRQFVEKRWLPPPPLEGSIEEDEDDECVGVMRYRILLTDSAGACAFGWISDRGRLACDSYTILEESSGPN